MGAIKKWPKVIQVAGLRKLILILLKPLCVIDFKESCPKYHNSTASDSQNLTASYSIYIYISSVISYSSFKYIHWYPTYSHRNIPPRFSGFYPIPSIHISSRVQVEYELFKSLGVVILEVLDALNWGVFRVRTVGISQSQTLTVQIAMAPGRREKKKKGAEVNAALTDPARVF